MENLSYGRSNLHPPVVHPPLDQQEHQPQRHRPPPQLPRLPAGRPGRDLRLPDLHRRPRLDLALVRIEQVDGDGNVIFSEATVSENLSLGGAAVFTTLNAPAGTFVRVTSDRFNVTILSIVRGRRTGPDGISRLHLEFIDRLFPLEGIVNN